MAEDQHFSRLTHTTRRKTMDTMSKAAGSKAYIQETGDSDTTMTALVEMLKEQQKSMAAQHVAQ